MRFRFAQVKNKRNFWPYLHYYDKPDCFYYFRLFSPRNVSEVYFGIGRIEENLRKKFYEFWFFKWNDENSYNFSKSSAVSYVLCLDPHVRCSKKEYKNDFVFAVVNSFEEVWGNDRQFALFFHDDTPRFHFHSLIHPVKLQLVNVESTRFKDSIDAELSFLKKELRKKLNAIFLTYAKDFKREGEKRSEEAKDRKTQKHEFERLTGLNSGSDFVKSFSLSCLRQARKRKLQTSREGTRLSFLPELKEQELKAVLSSFLSK